MVGPGGLEPLGLRMWSRLRRPSNRPGREKLCSLHRVPQVLARPHGSFVLAEARDKAREWLAQLQRGISPHAEHKRAEDEAKRPHDNTFGKVVETFIAEHLATKRRGRKDAEEIRRHILPLWSKRPISEITRSDVVALVKPLASRVPTTAHLILNHIKRIFSWAIQQRPVWS